MLLSSEELKKIVPEITALGDPLFNGETGSFLESILKGILPYRVFIVRAEGKLASFVILSAVCDEAEIIEIATSPDFRHKGFGSAALAEAAEWCRQNGVKDLFLEVRESNAAAIGLYEKYGFARIGMRKSYYSRPAENAVVMSKRSAS